MIDRIFSGAVTRYVCPVCLPAAVSRVCVQLRLTPRRKRVVF